jgi:alpha-L-rhamnosidase
MEAQGMVSSSAAGGRVQAAQTARGRSAGLTPAELRCEYRKDPLGVDFATPRLSWSVASARRGDRQTAYALLVSDDLATLAQDRGTLWDTGRRASDETTAIVYEGQPLRAHQACYWKVRVFDKDGSPSAWSEPAHWSMGLLQPADWLDASWIGFDRPRRSMSPDGSGAKTKAAHLILPSPVYLRKAFRTTGPVRRATLYATALGNVDVHLNGRRVSDDYFNPGWTDYNRRVYYRAYDVTPQIHTGENAVGAILADGWYSGYVGFGKRRDHYGKKPRFRALLRLEMVDGSTSSVVTSSRWRAAEGPIREADFLMGEVYDARRARAPVHRGWDGASFDDSRWTPADVGAELSPAVAWHPGPPVRVFAEVKPRSISQPKPGVWVIDMGQNLAGVIRLKVASLAGRKIVLRYAERLNPDGTIYTTNLREARATDTYHCAGDGEETWSPRFTFHGFQYVEITGLKSPPNEQTITGIALSSDTPLAGDFACSDPMLNQLHSNIYWTQRANFIDIPTDCPQRDERLGWTGDAQVYVGTAALVCDVQAFFTKWLVDLVDGQRRDGQFPMVAPVKVAGNDGGPAWADAGVICPWIIYQVYGDRRLLARQYSSMVKFIEFCRKRSTPELMPPKQFHCFGDWLSIKADTPKDVIYTAYFAHSAHLLAQAAETLGKPDDAARFAALADAVKATFNRAYVAPDGRIKGNTQACYVLGLAFGLVDGENAKRAAAYLIEDIEQRGFHLSTGFIGTKSLMQALSRIGRLDVAFRLLHNESFPSWGFSIKHGATSIWERWDGWTPEKGFQDPGMNSFAHYSFGAVYQWIVENIGGITSDGPSYKRVVIAPQLDPRLSWARTVYRSIRGEIVSSWTRNDAQLTLDVTIPANTTGRVILPVATLEAITESGSPLARAVGVKRPRIEAGRAVVDIDGGHYTFSAPIDG